MRDKDKMKENKKSYSEEYKKKYYLQNQKKLHLKNNNQSFEEKTEELAHNVKKALTTKKAKKIERYVVFLIYTIVFLSTAYFLLINVSPDVMPEDFYVYEISASDSLIENSLRSLYLEDSEALGGKTEFENETARLVVYEKPFNFIFNPKRNIKENTTAKIELQFLNPKTEVYLNENLIIPNLYGLKKVADFDTKEVWVKEELRKATYFDGETPEEFIYANFPGKSIYAFGEIEGGAPIIPDYKEQMTRIPTRFRGDLKLAVYAEGNLQMGFIKQDLNWYVGGDEYTVEITDLKGNSYFKEVYGDDGDKKDSNVGNFEQMVTVKGVNLPKNIYYITFTGDKNNKAADSTIKKISINTNKVLIIEKNLPIEPFSFYTEINSPQIIGFNFWHSGKDQKLTINGTSNKIIDLDESWMNKKYEEEFQPGEYTVEIPKGDLWVYSEVISPSKYAWFYLPKEGDKKLLNSDIIIIDKNQLNISGDDVTYTGKINVGEETKIKIQVLDKLEIYFKKIKLTL